MDVEVFPTSKVQFNNLSYQAALGKNGVADAGRKVEGDQKTPSGVFELGTVYYRPDRIDRPATMLPVKEITSEQGWCDDLRDLENYNTAIRLPYSGSHERLWRVDHLYDCVMVIKYNMQPIVPGKGSAVFMHLARAGYAPTAGCVALALEDLLAILKSVKTNTKIIIYSNKNFSY